jgi:hypothetical protein
MLQQILWILVDRKASRRPEFFFWKAAAQNANGPYAGLGRGLCIVRGVAHGDDLAGSEIHELFYGDGEDITVGFRSRHVVSRDFGLDQIGDPGDLFVGRYLVLFGRGCQNNPLSVGA